MVSNKDAKKFWSYVDKSDKLGCWRWRGGISGDGYGSCLIGGKRLGAHRASYLIAHGDVPMGLCVCHHCDNPKCVRPDHLFIGTYKDNMQDAVNKGRFVGTSIPESEVSHVALLYKTKTTQEIGLIYGCSDQTVGNFMHAHGLSMRRSGSRRKFAGTCLAPPAKEGE